MSFLFRGLLRNGILKRARFGQNSAFNIIESHVAQIVSVELEMLVD